MCLTKVYYNTYSDGSQDVSEKSYPCRDGRRCSRPEVRKYDRKFPFSKLGESQPESRRSLAERQPTPYFEPHTPRGSKSPSPSGRRDRDAYVSGTKSSKHRDYYDTYSFDPYGYYRSSSRHDPRDSDRYERGEPRLKRSSTLPPQIVYADRDSSGKSSSSRSRSRSSTRDYSRDIPIGLVPLVEEYGRRRRHSFSSGSRDGGSGDPYYYPPRRAGEPAAGYVLIDDQDERRRQRREARRLSSASGYAESSGAMRDYADASSSSSSARYLPRRASTVVHHGDGPVSAGSASAYGSASSSSSSKPPKQLRWEDEVRAKRERQNAEIASRPAHDAVEPPLKGILKRSESAKSHAKGKGRELDDIAELRRAVERMEIPRGRDREPRSRRAEWGVYGYGGGDIEDRDRRKRSKVWWDGGYY
ncbi:hypothetical protein VTK26DRAFT_6480 [Humicola hyalothermophila]